MPWPASPATSSSPPAPTSACSIASITSARAPGATNQRQVARDAIACLEQSARDACGRAASAALLERAQLLVQAQRLGLRLDPQLGVQQRAALRERPQRIVGAAQQVVQPHQRAVGFLAQRVGLHQPQRALQRQIIGLALLVGRQQALERAEILLAQALALVQRPIVVAILQEIAAIQLDRRAQLLVRAFVGSLSRS